MHSPKTEDEKLQMFFDGELAPEEEAAVRRSLEGSPEAAAQLREWEQLRTAMKSVATAWAKKRKVTKRKRSGSKSDEVRAGEDEFWDMTK